MIKIDSCTININTICTKILLVPSWSSDSVISFIHEVDGLITPDSISSITLSAVSNASVMVPAITPTGPLFAQPLQYTPTTQKSTKAYKH